MQIEIYIPHKQPQFLWTFYNNQAYIIFQWKVYRINSESEDAGDATEIS